MSVANDISSIEEIKPEQYTEVINNVPFVGNDGDAKRGNLYVFIDNSMAYFSDDGNVLCVLEDAFVDPEEGLDSDSILIVEEGFFLPE